MGEKSQTEGWSVERSGPREEVLRKAQEAYRRGVFDQVVEFLEPLYHSEELDPLPLSYYGASLVFLERDPEGGLLLCKQAAQKGFQFGEIHYNLGQAYAILGKKSEAVASFRKSLIAEPGRRATMEALRTLGLRRKPTFQSLPRAHPLNRLIGRITWWLGLRGEFYNENEGE